MADESDLDKLAKQYLDLWQDHMQSMATDPQIAQTMSQVTQMMTGSATAFAALAQQALNAQNTHAKNTQAKNTQAKNTQAQNAASAEEKAPPDDQPNAPGQTRSAAADSGAQAAGAAHGGGDLDLAELARRLDGIERRLAALESGHASPGADGTGGSAAKGPRKRRS